MTLVRNRLLPLSGNKWLLPAAMGLLLAACSPKIAPVATPVKPQPVDTPKKKEPEAIKPPPVIPATVISLLLPFHLDELDLSKGAPKSGLAKADLAVQYYQGFKLALDSLANNTGNKFKLQIFDTKDATAQAHNLALNTKIRTSAVIVGPVYPEEIKSFAAAAPSLKKMVVSPLSPASPADYKNPNLVTVIPPLDYHCWKTAEFIQGNLKAKRIFILKSGYSDENKYIIPFKKAIDSLSKRRIKVVELNVLRGNLSSIIPQLSHTEQNVFVVPANDQQFLQVTLHSLDQLLKQHYPVTLFGHPNWEDLTFLKPELLQHLNTYITSGDRVDYKSSAVIKFVKDYRRLYHTEPGEYAIKGYDEGQYFGKLAASGQNSLAPGDYNALHNTFRFVKIPGQGYVNTHVKLYKYTNFELKPVE